MKVTEGRLGRVFVIRFEDGDELPECIERFAEEKGVTTGHVILVGGIGSGRVVVGPENAEERPPQPMLLPISGVSEVAGVGVLAPDQNGEPVLHIHAALGRSGQTMTGCLRYGVTTWLLAEAILYEITGAQVRRVMTEEVGFKVLEVEGGGVD
jgi:predicted DNA-binding protein with PD1-like motif